MSHKEPLHRRATRRKLLTLPPLVAVAVVAASTHAQAETRVPECLADVWAVS